MAQHFVFKRRAVVSTPEGIVLGQREILVPEDVISKIPMRKEYAHELLSSLSPGMLHLLHQAGGSPRFSRALQLDGKLT